MVLEYSDNTIEKIIFLFFLLGKGRWGTSYLLNNSEKKIYYYPYTIFVLFQERFSWYYFGNWLFKFNSYSDRRCTQKRDASKHKKSWTNVGLRT